MKDKTKRATAEEIAAAAQLAAANRLLKKVMKLFAPPVAPP
jgi:hypothetical protein